MIGSYFVPEDTQVSVHLYSANRDPRNFYPLPEEFWPDRWIPQEQYTLPSGDKVAASQVIMKRDVFNPFGFGPQNCAGKAIALMEMRAVLCALVHKFDIQVADQASVDAWERNVHDYWVTHRGPLIVRLRTRH